MSDLLPVLEERVRALTEDFKISQWAVLYHTHAGTSFFFPRRGGKVEVPHHDHPDFFKRVLSIGREMTGNTETLCLEDGNLRNLIFGSSISSSAEKPVFLLPILGGNTVLASLISGDRNPSPEYVDDSLRETERKILRKSARLLGTFLELHNRQLLLEAGIRWGKGKRSGFTDWLEWVKKEVKSCEYFLYWVREASGKSEPLYLTGSREVEGKTDKVNQFLKNWNSKPGVMVSAGGGNPVTRDIKTKMKPFLKQEESSLIFTLPFSSGVAEKVFQRDAGRTNYLVIEFVRNPSQKHFDDSDYFYALSAYEDLKGRMEETVSSLAGLSKGPASERTDCLIDLYQKNQLQIAAVRHPLTSASKTMIKTDLKPGLNVGNLFSNFKYFRIREVSPTDRSILTAGINYFLSHALDMMDYEKKIKGFLQESLPKDPLEGYLFMDLDSPTTTSPADPDKRASVGIVSGGFHLFHYSFEEGSMKRIPDRGYRVMIHPGEDDILLAFPASISIKENGLKQIENEMVVFGQTFPEKLVTSLWKFLGGTDFLLLKKSRLV